MIDPNKKYQIRSGGEVRILCVDAPGDQPVIALDSTGDITRHSLDGRYYLSRGESSSDLVEVREPRELWVNEYREGSSIAYKSEQEAKLMASPGAERHAVHYREVLEP